MEQEEFKEYKTEIFTMTVDIDMYPKLEWVTDKKYGVTLHSNGVVMRGHNFRTSILEYETEHNSGWLVTSHQIIKHSVPDITDHPMFFIKRIRGNMYKTQRLIKKESQEMNTWGLHTYLTNKQNAIIGAWTHPGTKNEEE